MISFFIDYLIFFFAIPLQSLALLGAFQLRAQKVPVIFYTLLLSSLILLLTLGTFLAVEAFEEFSASHRTDHVDYETRLLLLFGLWGFGMAAQLAALLFLCLRFKALSRRNAELEKIANIEVPK